MLPFPATFTSLFRIRSFTWLWISSAFGTLGLTISMLVLSWDALQKTNSSAAVGAVLAARFAPSLIFGLPAGFISDLLDRRKLLILANLGSAAISIAAAGIANIGVLRFGLLLGIAATLGIIDALRVTASQAYVYDTVGTEKATNAIALTLIAGQVFGIPAGLVGGTLIKQYGATAAFLAVGIASLMAAVCLLPIHGHSFQQRLLPKDGRETQFKSAALLRNSSILLLAAVVVATEVFAFSSATLLPNFARDIFRSGASGLGLLYVARSIGGTFGLIIIASLPKRVQGRRLLLALSAVCGFTLVVFSITANFTLALLVMAFIGFAMTSVDALAQSLLQHNATNNQRGLAIGVWTLSTGFGLIGDLEVGVAAVILGAPHAQSVNGAILVILILALSMSKVAKQPD